jgi:hypothetical protein
MRKTMPAAIVDPDDSGTCDLIELVLDEDGSPPAEYVDKTGLTFEYEQTAAKGSLLVYVRQEA